MVFLVFTKFDSRPRDQPTIEDSTRWIHRTYKGSRPPIVSICFTCGFQMFNPVAGYMLRVYIYILYRNVNVTSLILS